MSMPMIGGALASPSLINGLGSSGLGSSPIQGGGNTPMTDALTRKLGSMNRQGLHNKLPKPLAGKPSPPNITDRPPKQKGNAGAPHPDALTRMAGASSRPRQPRSASLDGLAAGAGGGSNTLAGRTFPNGASL